MKRQGREEPYVYTSNPRVGFGEKYSLTLLNATPEDSGSYECAINADIGGQNQNIRVDLVVNGELDFLLPHNRNVCRRNSLIPFKIQRLQLNWKPKHA